MSTNWIWVGVDPGYTSTGIAVRDGDELLHHAVVTRAAIEDPWTIGIGRHYIGEVLDAVIHARVLASCVVRAYVAIEGVSAPKGFKGGRHEAINPKHLMGAAMVAGAVLALEPDAVIVPPGKNGSALLATYPPALVTPAERRQGLQRPAGQSANVRHARSAWDVTLRAPGVDRELAAWTKASA